MSKVITASFYEVLRWFKEAYESCKKERSEAWVKELERSNVVCRAVNHKGETVGWFRIDGFENHGTNVTLRIEQFTKG